MNGLTQIQIKVLEYIVREVRGGLPPSHRDIMKNFAWRSNAASRCHLIALEKKGFIRCRIRVARGIELKPAAQEWFNARQQTGNQEAA